MLLWKISTPRVTQYRGDPPNQDNYYSYNQALNNLGISKNALNYRKKRKNFVRWKRIFSMNGGKRGQTLVMRSYNVTPDFSFAMEKKRPTC